MTARLLSLACRVWRRVWPHEVVDARRAWGRDVPVPGAGAADARARRVAAVRRLGDEDIDRVLRGIEREFTVPGPRDGGA